MADENPPAQHTPVHLRGDVFDERHPAASAFAPVQPGAGVVADDADERDQNEAGGEKASDAEKTYADQKEVLEQQHEDSLQAAVAPAAAAVKAEDTKAADKPAADAKADTKASEPSKAADKPSTSAASKTK